MKRLFSHSFPVSRVWLSRAWLSRAWLSPSRIASVFLLSVLLSVFLLYPLVVEADEFRLTNFSGFRHFQSNVSIVDKRMYARKTVKDIRGQTHFSFDFPSELQKIQQQNQLQSMQQTGRQAILNTAALAVDGFMGRALLFSTVEEVFYTPVPQPFIASKEDYSGSFSLGMFIRPDAQKREMGLYEMSSFMHDGVGKGYFERFALLLRRGNVVVEFENFFKFRNKRISLQLSSNLPLRLREWNHLHVSFDRETGLVKLSIDGKVADYRYATADSTRDSEIYLPNLHSRLPMQVEVGRRFIGSIDEINISNNTGIAVLENTRISPLQVAETPFVSTYQSKVFRLKPYSKLKKIELLDSDFAEQDVLLEVCHSQDYFVAFASRKELTCTRSDRSHNFIQTEEALYYQLNLKLKNNERKENRSFSGFNIVYDVDERPFSPKLTRVEALEDGTFLLVWQRSGEEDIRGYSVYFSTSSFREIDGRQIRLDIPIAELQDDNATIGLNLQYHYRFIDPTKFQTTKIGSSSNTAGNKTFADIASANLDTMPNGNLEGLYYFALRSYDKMDTATGRKRQSPTSNVVSSYLRLNR